MRKYLFTLIAVIICFVINANQAFAKDTYPTGISLNGSGTYCQAQTAAAITIPCMPTTSCGTGSNTNVPNTTTIYSNTTNATTGGTSVATLTNSLFCTNATYTPPTNTCGTMYYYAVVSWGAQGCAAAGSITSATIAVTTDCSCTQPSSGVSTINTCSTTWYDSGGSGGSYGSSESYTITFCPTGPGQAVQVDFTSFATQGGGGTCNDMLDLWHGNVPATTGTNDDRFCGTLGAFTIVSANSDGCVTFKFTSDGSTVDAGWAATISCVTGCNNPTGGLVDASTVDICPSTSVTPGSTTVSFDGSASTAAAGQSISSYEWDWGDGTTSTTVGPTTTHTYPTTGGIYVATLRVRDNNTSIDPLGCRSTNSVTRIIRVLPTPLIVTSYTADAGCETVDLTAVATSQTYNEETPTAVADVTNLPDGSGASYSSGIDYSGFFAPGATVTSACYPIITFNLEHSYSGDLEMVLIAPSGEQVMFYDQHGGTTKFGSCVNGSDANPVVPGCGATYTVVGDGSGVAWTAAGVTQTTPMVNGNCSWTGTCETGNYYIPQTYNSFQSFAGFNGAQLNGVWTLQIIDKITLDNGVLFSWSIDFPIACYKPLETVTPDLSTLVWSHSGSGPALPAQTTTSTVVVDPGPDPCQNAGTCVGNELTNIITVGTFTSGGTYTYTVLLTDEYGCQYSEDIEVVLNCPLPVELLSFAGEYIQDAVHLKWTTASEINNDYFTIERSKDGNLFESIGHVKGAGNSNDIINYKYKDESPSSGIVYYRLKQTDFDSKFEYSELVAVTIKNDNESFSVYPNPAGNNAEISFNAYMADDAVLNIMDVTGRLVLRKKVSAQKGKNAVKLDISNYTKGIYFVTLTNQQEVLKTKFIKE